MLQISKSILTDGIMCLRRVLNLLAASAKIERDQIGLYLYNRKLFRTFGIICFPEATNHFGKFNGVPFKVGLKPALTLLSFFLLVATFLAALRETLEIISQ